MATNAQVQVAQAKVKAILGKTMMDPINGMTVIPTTMLTSGREIRDVKIWKLPILPEALIVYQQLASSREWSISGSVKYAQRALEGLQRAITINPSNGYVHFGFEDFTKRRILDYLAVGRTTFTYNSNRNTIEYLDPTRLTFQSNMKDSKQRYGGVADNAPVWRYANERTLRFKEVIINHPFPIGTDYFIAPVVTVLPTAILAWLMREHDKAAIDGRKIRDILFVGSPQMQVALENAVNISAALYTGASTDDVGIPVVEVSNPSGGKIQDMIGRLGISEIPDSFNREEFIFQYVNEIAAALGLALRHFWNNERTTNRALEVVQEQRQQQKGPSSFIRTEQRLINESGILEQISDSKKKLRFAYIEEVDTASQKDKAEVLEKNAQALKTLYDIFGASIDPTEYLRWMQSMGVVPFDLKLSLPDKMPAAETTLTPEGNMNTEGETTVASDETDTSAPTNSSADNFRKTKQAPPIEDDEITIDMHGKIVDYRRKAFTVERVMTNLIKVEVEQEEEEIVKSILSEEDVALAEVQRANQMAFREFYVYKNELVVAWLAEKTPGEREKYTSSIDLLMAQSSLDANAQSAIDTMLIEIEEDENVSA